MIEIAGVGIGCEAGQRPFREYAIWLLWSVLVARPFEQFGKLTWSSRFVGALQSGSPAAESVGVAAGAELEPRASGP